MSEKKRETQLRTIRKVFSDLRFVFTERDDPETKTTFFTIDTDGETDAIYVVHEPGLLTLYASFAVRPEKKQRKELERFASRLNAGIHDGCVVIRENAILYRVSINYRMVKNLHSEYIASAIDRLTDMIEPIDVPLILIAKGSSADEAIEKVLDLPVVDIY
jgi:hypothetical protein